jgi:hypothetical protein
MLFALADKNSTSYNVNDPDTAKVPANTIREVPGSTTPAV